VWKCSSFHNVSKTGNKECVTLGKFLINFLELVFTKRREKSIEIHFPHKTLLNLITRIITSLESLCTFEANNNNNINNSNNNNNNNNNNNHCQPLFKEIWDYWVRTCVQIFNI